MVFKYDFLSYIIIGKVLSNFAKLNHFLEPNRHVHTFDEKENNFGQSIRDKSVKTY
jgi:hypothetical protein